MLRLILVRHAKSAWDDPGLADIDRPLARRGLEAAAWIGDTLRKHDWIAQTILCSPSRRTRETLELALGRMPAAARGAEIVWSEEVYAQRDRDYLGLIAERGGDAAVVMVVGHNPATGETAASLCGDEAGIGQFPTGGIAVIDVEVSGWSGIVPGSGRLVRFLRPPKG